MPSAKTWQWIKWTGLALSVPVTPAAIVGFHSFLAEHVAFHNGLAGAARAQEVTQQIRAIADSANQAADAAQKTATALEEYVKRQELKEARAKLNVLREQLSGTQLWESANGANEISRARKADLAWQIERTTDFVECLEAMRRYCEQP